MIEQYKVIQSDGLDRIQAEVNAAVKDGFTPSGSLIWVNDLFTQAMIRHDGGGEKNPACSHEFPMPLQDSYGSDPVFIDHQMSVAILPIDCKVVKVGDKVVVDGVERKISIGINGELSVN